MRHADLVASGLVSSLPTGATVASVRRGRSTVVGVAPAEVVTASGVDGFAAIEAMLGDDAARRVVVLSGSADPADLDKARAVGAFGYLTKERIATELVPEVLAAAVR